MTTSTTGGGNAARFCFTLPILAVLPHYAPEAHGPGLRFLHGLSSRHPARRTNLLESFIRLDNRRAGR